MNGIENDLRFYEEVWPLFSSRDIGLIPKLSNLARSVASRNAIISNKLML